MNLHKALSDTELWSQTANSALAEKKATLCLLEYLAEVQRRRLYAKRGYSSLFTYVVMELGYSESQTSERINALRLMAALPEVKEKIEQGVLSLTTASQIQRFLNTEKKNHDSPLDTSKKLELVAQCEGQSKRQVEKILKSHSKSPTDIRDLKLKVDSKFIDKLEEVRIFEGYALSIEQILERALASHLEKLNAKQKLNTKSEKYLTGKSARPVSAEQKQGTRYIRVVDRNETLKRAQYQCEFSDPQTGRRCESRSKLQFEHRKPHAVGGSNQADNLLIYCAAHNQLQAIRFFGAKKMSNWISGIG